MKQYLDAKFKNKKVLILGFGREGRSTYKLLREHFPNQLIGIADQSEITDLTDVNIQRYSGEDYLKHLETFEIIIKSPGVSALKKEIQSALKKGIEITSQTKIFFDVCKGNIIGITGTKGKSTTASLIYEILKKGGLDVLLVGNIGSPVFDSLSADSEGKHYVFELSSHQLFDLTKSPHISVVTNISVDHLDWYQNFENYVDAKTNILKHQTQNDVAILNWDNLIVRGFDRFVKGKTYFVSRENKVNGAYVKNKIINFNLANKDETLGNTDELKLIGQHNWDNVMQASLVAKIMGIQNRDIWETVCRFEQLEHHLEFVKEQNGVLFYNDSFAVDQIATIAAINSFDRQITLIVGGFDRGIDFTELSKELSERDNVKNVIVIGQISDSLAGFIKKSKYKGNLIKLGKAGMDKIVKTAVKHTANGGIVLFSPAAASFDMFKDYKDRGEQFKKVVNALAI